MGIEELGSKGLTEGAKIAGRGFRRVVAKAEAVVGEVSDKFATAVKDVPGVKDLRGKLPAMLRTGEQAVEMLRGLNARIIKDNPEMAKLKFERMAVGQNSYLRGANPLFGMDLAQEAKVPVKTMLQGDAHPLNLGTYEPHDGTAALYFNDFDDAVKGPFDWDLRRKAVGLMTAAHEAGFGAGHGEKAVTNMLEAYRKQVGELAGKGSKALDRPPEVRSGVAKKAVEKAARKDRAELLDKWTQVSPSGDRRFKVVNGKLLKAGAEERKAMVAAVEDYLKSVPKDLRREPEFYQVKDVAVRVAGTGSLGNKSYYVLIEGKGPGGADDFILHFKQQPGAAYANPLGQPPARHEGERAIEAQQLLQPGADRYLGHVTVDGAHYSVGQVQPARSSLDLEDIPSGKDLEELAGDAGTILAHAHARAGDAGAIRDYLQGKGAGLLDDVAAFAKRYGAQVEEYLAAFRAALKKDPLLGG